MIARQEGYGTTVAYCAKCGRALIPAPARWDGEPTTVGYNPCPVHPGEGVRYEAVR